MPEFICCPGIHFVPISFLALFLGAVGQIPLDKNEKTSLLNAYL